MAFTVNDFADLRQLLYLHPEWRAELQQLLMPDDMFNMPALLRELAQSHQRAERRLDRVEATLAELARFEKRSEARFERLEATVAELVEAQKRSEVQVRELAEAQKRTEVQVEKLTAALEVISSRLDHLTDRVARLDGRDLERHYRERAGAFFGRWLRPVSLVLSDALRETLEARLPEEDVEDVMRLDLLIQGQARRLPDTPERLVAFEVSVVVDRGDVEQARRRAALLQRAGLHAAPGVAGERLTLGAVEASQEAPLIVLQDGRSTGWDEALAAA